MKRKKSIIIMLFAIFLLAMATASASEDAAQADLSKNNEMVDDNPQTCDENVELTLGDSENDFNEDTGKFSELSKEIGSGGNKTLKHKNYVYDIGSTIVITVDNSVIDGNGSVIDMSESTFLMFRVEASGVTIKNLTIKNSNRINYAAGIFQFERSGTLMDCNFINNTAYVNGWSPISFLKSGTVVNCTFVNNSACSSFSKGGALYFDASGTVVNCTFVNNSADSGDGGAVHFHGSGNVTDCSFVNNRVNSTSYGGGAVYFRGQGFVGNSVFSNNTSNSTYGGGGAIYFDDSATVINCGFVNNFANSTEFGDGGAIFILGSSIVENCTFINNSVGSKGHAGSVYFTDSSTVINCSFTDNSAYLGGAIRLRGQDSEVFDCNFINNSASIIGGAVCMDGGRLVNCNFVGNTVGNSDFGGGAVLIYYNGGEVIKCNFTGNSALSDAGALYLLNPAVVSNCNFVTNKASRKGGAVYMNYKDRVENCSFADNSACCGGAIYSNVEGDVAYCRFTGNDASNGSAIYFNSSSTDKRIANSILLKNRADSKALDVNINENKITITFKGCNNLLNAIYSLESVSFTNVTYWGEDGVMNTDEGRYRMSDGESGQNIAVGVIVDDVVVLKDVKVTDADGKVVLDINPRENYLIGIYHDSDSYYTHSERIISDMKFYVNVTSQTTKNRIVNITAKSNIYGEVLRNKLQFILQNGNSISASYAGDGMWWAKYTFDNCGDYNVGASYDGLDNVTVANASIIINRAETELIAAAITATYNINRNLVITLKDCNGYIVPGVGVSVDLNGHKTFTTDEKGQIKLSTAGLAPKTYIAKISFVGNNNYIPSSCNVKIVVKKATPKINAKKKTFRQSEKVKRYGIVLKSNVGKGIERAQVTLKIGKKTYKAKTNAKGKATFKIKKLTRKGTYKATATYKGNRFYNGVVKKVKITVK